MLGRTYDYRQPLADIEHVHPGLARCRPFGPPEQRRQQQAQTEPACREAARQQQPDDAEQGQQGRGERWRGLFPDRPDGQPAEKSHQTGEQPMVEMQQWRPGDDGEQQRQRGDHEADQRDGDGIGQRRHQRELLKHQQQQRQRADGHRPLRRPPPTASSPSWQVPIANRGRHPRVPCRRRRAGRRPRRRARSRPPELPTDRAAAPAATPATGSGWHPGCGLTKAPAPPPSACTASVASAPRSRRSVRRQKPPASRQRSPLSAPARRASATHHAARASR